MAVLETTATRRKIVKELQRNKIGFTARELSESLKIKVQTISATLQQMTLGGFVQRGELIEGEGQIWEVTELGIAEYGVKSDLEVKTSVQESVLEKKLPDGWIAEVVKQITQPEPITEEITETEKEFVALPLTTNKKGISVESFKVWQIVDEAGAKMVELLLQEKAKPIENIDYKIATLESLADIYNQKISATLREIAADLRG